jgi:hypothetical protein
MMNTEQAAVVEKTRSNAAAVERFYHQKHMLLTAMHSAMLLGLLRRLLPTNILCW